VPNKVQENQPPLTGKMVDRFRYKYWERERPSNASGVEPAVPISTAVGVARLRSVLVLLDGSQYAEHAIPMALTIAGRTGADVQLAHVQLVLGSTYDVHSFSFEEASGFRRKQRMREYIDGVAERISNVSPVEIAPAPCSGQRATETLTTIATSETLVVLANRCRGALGWFHFGSVAERFLNVGSSPLLFVRGHHWPVNLKDSKPLGHVLTVLDGRAESERILKPAAAMAATAQAKHTLLRVVPGTPYYGIPWKEKEHEAAVYLNRVADRLRDRGSSDVTTEIVSSDEATGQVILAYAQRSNANVIALAARRQSGLPGFFRRDPAEYLIRNGMIPVLVARTDADERRRATT
jgi:nucleotide-binding universal stress UspA family protein